MVVAASMINFRINGAKCMAYPNTEKFQIQFTVGDFYDWARVVVREFVAGAKNRLRCVEESKDRGVSFDFYKRNKELPIVYLSAVATAENAGSIEVAWVKKGGDRARQLLLLFSQIPGIETNIHEYLFSVAKATPVQQGGDRSSTVQSLAELEPPIPVGSWQKRDWCIFFEWIKKIHGKSQPDWQLWAGKTGKAYSTIRTMYSRYLNGELDCT